MIKQTVICDNCNKVCEDTLGVASPVAFTVVGNIHVMKSDQPDGIGGGLVGNMKNATGENNPPTVSHYCKRCLTAILEGKDTRSDPYAGIL